MNGILALKPAFHEHANSGSALTKALQILLKREKKFCPAEYNFMTLN
jgi:hypothetical protein